MERRQAGRAARHRSVASKPRHSYDTTRLALTRVGSSLCAARLPFKRSAAANAAQRCPIATTILATKPNVRLGCKSRADSRHRPCWPGSHSAARIAHLLGVQGHLQIIPCVSEPAIAALAQRSFRFLRCVAPPCWRHATLLRKLHNSAGVSRTLQTVKYPRLSAPPPVHRASLTACSAGHAAFGAGGAAAPCERRLRSMGSGSAVEPTCQGSGKRRQRWHQPSASCTAGAALACGGGGLAHCRPSWPCGPPAAEHGPGRRR